MVGSPRGKTTLQSIIEALSSPSRFSLFLLVGTIGAICDNVLLILLVEFDYLSPVLGGVVSKEVSIMVMFLLNERLTFRDVEVSTRLFDKGKRFLRSNVVRSGGLAVGLGALFVLHEMFGMWYVLANILGIGMGFLVNYVFENVITWKSHH